MQVILTRDKNEFVSLGKGDSTIKPDITISIQQNFFYDQMGGPKPFTIPAM